MKGDFLKRIGSYVILQDKMIGNGAYAEVFRGHECQPTSNLTEPNHVIRDVAIKILFKQKMQKDSYIKKAFFDELKIMKKVKSNNVIQLYHSVETINNYYLFLQLAQGGTLRSYLNSKKKLDEATARRFLGQIVNGFGELAKHGIVHRDLKPQNILIKGDVLKIADFGLAKIQENHSFFFSTVGTPRYMAPQVLSQQQQKYSYKCDIWSLGVVAYQMMVGRIPWIIKQFNLEEIRKQVTTQKIIFPDNIEISSKMKQFILGCLRIEEDDRFDWDQVFSHPIFHDKFSANLTRKGKNQIGYIVAEFRLYLHQNNININKCLSKSYGNKLNKVQFFKFLTSVDKQMCEENIAFLFKYLVKEDQHVYVEDFKKILHKYKCRLTGIDPSQIEIEEGSDAREGLILMTRLKKCIDKNNLDINQLFMENTKQKNKCLNFSTFAEFILKIDPSCNNDEIKCLFNVFDLNSDGKISQSELQKGICKIAEIVPLEKEDMDEISQMKEENSFEKKTMNQEK